MNVMDEVSSWEREVAPVPTTDEQRDAILVQGMNGMRKPALLQMLSWVWKPSTKAMRIDGGDAA